MEITVFFASICDKGWDMDASLPFGIKLAGQRVGSNMRKPLEVTKTTNVGFNVVGRAWYKYV